MRFWAAIKEYYASQATDRMSYALIALIVALAVSWILQVNDQNIVSRARLETLSRQAAEFEDQATLAEWAGRAREAADVSHQWHVRAWSAPTPGVAAAEMQAALLAQAERAGLARTQITVHPESILVNGQPVLRFELIATARPRAALSAFVALSNYEKRLLVVEAAYEQSPLGGPFRLSGMAPIDVTAPEDVAEPAQ